jgi:hypothetical protein
MKNRRTFLRVFFVLAAFGVISLLALLSRLSVISIRAVDFVHITGTGLCFGGAIIALVAYFRGDHHS